MRTSLLRLTLAAASIAVFAAAATAAPRESNDDDDKWPRAVERACGSEARRLCPTEKAGTPGQRYCMEAKQQSFTHSCKRALEDSGVAPRGYFTNRS